MLQGEKLLWWELDKLAVKACEDKDYRRAVAFSNPIAYLEKPTPEECQEQHRLEASRESTKIICLCGSSRFIEHLAIMGWELEKRGAIVLGLHYLPQSYFDNKAIGDHLAEAEGVAERFDKLHLKKIDLADEVMVLNVGGYIGESTAREIAYAEAHNKPIRYLEDEGR